MGERDEGDRESAQKKHGFTFLSWLCSNVAGINHKPLTSKEQWEAAGDNNQWKEKEWENVMRILWGKFNEFRKRPNAAQMIKIDNVSDGLKEFFLEKEEKQSDDEKARYKVNLKQIMGIFPHLQEIQYFNQHRFDDDVLRQLVEIMERNAEQRMKFGVFKPMKLGKLRFLYYDYPLDLDEPAEGETFFDPNKLDDGLVHRLRKFGWTIQSDTVNVEDDEARSYGFRITVSVPNESFAAFNEREGNELKQDDIEQKTQRPEMQKVSNANAKDTESKSDDEPADEQTELREENERLLRENKELRSPLREERLKSQ